MCASRLCAINVGLTGTPRRCASASIKKKMPPLFTLKAPTHPSGRRVAQRKQSKAPDIPSTPQSSPVPSHTYIPSLSSIHTHMNPTLPPSPKSNKNPLCTTPSPTIGQSTPPPPAPHARLPPAQRRHAVSQAPNRESHHRPAAHMAQCLSIHTPPIHTHLRTEFSMRSLHIAHLATPPAHADLRQPQVQVPTLTMQARRNGRRRCRRLACRHCRG